MVLVKMLTSRLSSRGYQFAGDVIELEPDEAREAVQVGHAEIIETAMRSPEVETRTTKRKGTKR